jgi:hypothetical protein
MKPSQRRLFQPSAFILQPFFCAFGSDWAQLEAGTCGRRNLRFRDPLNRERRFIPLRLDDASPRLFSNSRQATNSQTIPNMNIGWVP